MKHGKHTAKRRGLFWSAAVLLICNFISRVLGFIYKIILVRLIGTEGIGITEMTGPVYSFALVAASLGIPMALSRLLAKEIGRRSYRNIRRIQKTATILLALLGGAASVICCCFAPGLLAICGVSAGADYLRILSPAVLLVTVCSGFRAYFQATKQIGIIGVSQNLEQTVRVTVGSVLVYLALPYGPKEQIAAVAAATLSGEFCGLLFILRAYLKQRPQYTKPPNVSPGAVVFSLLSFGAPVTVQKLIMSAILMLQALLIPLALQKGGLSAAQATDAYGNFSGVALSLIHLPGIFTATLAMALLPSIAETEQNPARLNSRINQSLHITTVIGLPFMLLFYEFSDELCLWLFNAPGAAASLRVLSVAAVFIYAQTALTSILQGLGKLTALFLSLVCSGGLFIGAIWVLVPRFGPGGAAAAELLFAAAASVIDLYFLRRYTLLRPDWQNIIAKPLAAALLADLSAKTAEKLLSAAALNQYTEFLLLSLAGGLAYIITLLLLGGLPRIFFHYIRPLKRLNP